MWWRHESLGNHAVVLRDGNMTAYAERKDIDLEWIVRNMVGDNFDLGSPPTGHKMGDVALTIDSLTVPGPSGAAYNAVDRMSLAVRAGETPMELGPGDQPQRQPVVRIHPETGANSLYLCEAGQMDWIDGPFVGMEPGPDGEGAKLLYKLMAHYTRPEFVYAHDWDKGDLVIYDNRTLIHAATWFDTAQHQRLMWRTTVSGNPGAEYAGEAKSWVVA